MSTASTKLITGDELLAMGDIGRCELIRGELIMMSPSGSEHGMIAMRVGGMLNEFVEAHDLGVVLAAETGFKIAASPDTVRAPDAGFVLKERVGRLSRKFFDGPSDIAIEVVSPDDTPREVAEKTAMWLARGCTSVWIVDPDTTTVTVHRTGDPPKTMGPSDQLTDEPLLPGFVLPIGKI